jgi:hypothetical protein
MTSSNNNWFLQSGYFDIRKKSIQELYSICKSHHLCNIQNMSKEEIIQCILKNVPIYIDGELEYKLYSKELIHNIVEYIKSYQIKISFTKNNKTSYVEIHFIKEKAILTLIPHKTWNDIKILIDRILLIHKLTECSICLNKTGIKIDFNRCINCYNVWCMNCNIEFIKSGNGIIKCPFCRDKTGTILPDIILDNILQQMTIDLYIKSVNK